MREKEISPYIEFVPSFFISYEYDDDKHTVKIRVEKLPSIKKGIRREMEWCLMETNKTFAAVGCMFLGGREKSEKCRGCRGRVGKTNFSFDEKNSWFYYFHSWLFLCKKYRIFFNKNELCVAKCKMVDSWICSRISTCEIVESRSRRGCENIKKLKKGCKEEASHFLAKI